MSADGVDVATLPPFVYLPVAPGGAPDDAEVELRTLTDGRVALLAYSALDRLETCCGPHQPWRAFPTAVLDDIATQQPYDLVLLDHPLPTEVRHPAPEG